MKPAISIVMPTYNGAAFLEEALASVYLQTIRPSEIIIVDDASRDETRTLVSALARTAPVPIRLIARGENSGGPAGPLNQGIAVASGEYIAVLDQDDVFTPTKLEDQVSRLAGDANLTFAFSLCGRYDRPGETVASQVALDSLRAGRNPVQGVRHLRGADVLRLLLTYGNFIIGYPGLVFRRKDWERKGGLDECLRIASDYEFACWLCLQGDVAFIDRIHYLRRIHGANLCNRVEVMQIEACRVRAHYLAHEPWVLDDAQLSGALRQSTFDLAYLLRQRGHYREALRQYGLSLRTWGWEARTLTAMAKLLPHWARRRILASRAA